MEKLLEVKDLKTSFKTNVGEVQAVRGVSFHLDKGEALGIVGESGCGKSVTMMSIMRLLADNGKLTGGEIHFDGKDISNVKESVMEGIRGNDIGMIFQDPMTALNPVYTIGYQIMENILGHEKVSKKEAYDRTLNLLIGMGIPFPEQRINEYPHQFSGGMRQRAMIAMAMSCNPKVLIADEPTTALDVTIQAQIFELMEKLKRDYETAILLITHDMGVVAELADEVAVMYMGNIIESGDVREVLKTPAHPYTEALLKSIPILGKGREQELHPIKGSTPDPFDRPIGCQFAPRCNYACEKCNTMPSEEIISKTHMVRCWKHKEVINNGSK